MITTLFKKKPLMEIFLVEAAKEFFEKAKQEKALTLVSNTQNQQSSLEILKDLGLSNSENARSIANQILTDQQIRGDLERRGKLIRAMKSIQRTFDGKSYLISYEKFKELLKKYNLETGHIKEYRGVIPEKNIQDLVKVKQNLPNLSPDIILNVPEGFSPYAYDIVYVTEVKFGDGDSSDFDEGLRNHFKQGNRFIEVDKGIEKKTWSAIHIHGFGRPRYNYLTEVSGYRIGRQDFFIACPKKYLQSNGEIKISKKPVDPIVFQWSEYGVLIHTVWGKEAEDKILKEYQELNGLL